VRGDERSNVEGRGKVGSRGKGEGSRRNGHVQHGYNGGEESYKVKTNEGNKQEYEGWRKENVKDGRVKPRPRKEMREARARYIIGGDELV
jgi:hypothetical protein